MPSVYLLRIAAANVRFYRPDTAAEGWVEKIQAQTAYTEKVQEQTSYTERVQAQTSYTERTQT